MRPRKGAKISFRCVWPSANFRKIMAAEKRSSNRGSLWEDDEVLALINVWSDIRMQQDLDGCSRRRHVYEKMAVQLRLKVISEAIFKSEKR